MKSTVRSLLVLSLLIAISGIAHAQSSTCAPFGTFSLSNGTYTVQNNEWNSTATQCISATEPSSFSITQSAISNSTSSAPGSYPSIYRGCHWGNCTTNSGLPLQVSNIGSALTSWNTTQPGSGAYDVAYDIWFNQTPTTNGQPDGAELMIWLNSTGGVEPAGGAPVGQATINGTSYTVWATRMSTWNYIAYVSNTPATMVANLDLRGFINDAVTRGSINSAWYLIDVEAGFELWQGGAGLATNSFSFSSSAGGTNPSISGLNPTSGAAGTTVTISGSNFGSSQGANTVTFGSTAATVTSWSSNSISATVPNLPAGNVSVTVNVGGVSSNSATFNITGTSNSNILISLQAISPNPSHVGTATNSTVNFTNQASTFASVTLVSELTDQTGNIIASQSQAANLAPQQTLAVTLTSFPASVGSYNVVGVVKDTAGNVLQQSTVGTLTVN